MRKRIAALAASMMFAAPHMAAAAIVTLNAADFPEVAVEIQAQGFRLESNCHFHAGAFGNFSTDLSGCYPESTFNLWNPDFILPEYQRNSSSDPIPSVLYFDRFGEKFDVLSMSFARFGGGVTFIASTGESVLVRSPNFVEPFSREFDWKNITWLLMVSPNAGAASSTGPTSLTFRVPEPGTLALLGLSLLAIGLARRRVR